MPTPAIDAVLFDLGNVLIDWNPRHLYRRLIDDEVRMERFLAEVCNHDWNIQMDGGKPFAQGVAELSRRHPEEAALIEAFWTRWPEMLGGAIAGTVDLLAALRANGLRVHALTNWSAETFPHARHRFGFLNWFEHIVVSGEIGLVKPDPAIFRHAIERCRLEPARTLFIDDSPVNVAGATAVGLQTHHFTGAAALRAILEQLGALPAGTSGS